ncbi:MAG: cation diffusion facilitator family transporter [Lachnospiraceae bacterium]|jgi:cation diffusion facilitator family transporter|nr:cation diffusion facilitator family transporter [Lachnospiraceae bacterium]MCI1328211.1 cation diffusion facilitator family transporter [Lachnospiraceae bacterium]
MAQNTANFVEARNSRIIRTSLLGILANVALAVFKAMVGFLTNSIAIVLDAVNNLSDALSSVITIIGTKLAEKKPDKKHPLGHGRIEYLTAMIIAVIVLYAGVMSLDESVKKILHPEKAAYTTVSLIIIVVVIGVKILLGRHVKKVGTELKSGSLINSGQDAMLDAVISASTLAAAVIYIATGVGIEAWLGAVIACVIIKAGIDMLRDTFSQILGERADPELSRAIKRTINSYDGVNGTYDLILHNYGPDTLLASVHIEIPDTWTAHQIDELTRAIQRKIYQEYGVVMTAIGIYSMNTHDDQAAEVETNITRIVMSHDSVLQMHGFYFDQGDRRISFDVVIDFACEDRKGEYDKIVQEVHEAYPDYELVIAMDADTSD